MPITQSRASVPNVTRRNDLEVLYLLGNESTNGSIRLIKDQVFGTELEIQLRSNGVWNDTGIVVAASTIYLGRELKLSGAGEWLLSRDASESLKALVPHTRIESDENDGTEPHPSTPVLSTKQTQVELIGDANSLGTATEFSITLTLPAAGLQNAFYLRIGATAPVEQVSVEFWRNVRDVAGNLFFSRNYPASTFPANSLVRVEEGEIVEGQTGDIVIAVFKSDTAFELLGSTTFNMPYYAIDYWPLSLETSVTLETGLNRWLADSSGNFIADNNGAPVYDGEGLSI